MVTVAAVIAAALALFGSRAFRSAPENAVQRTVKFSFTPSQLLRGSTNNVDAEVSISGDGKHIAYVESQGGQLWIRDIDQEQARPVSGATGVYQAFWSPDNQFLGYSAGQNCGVRGGCDLVRIPVQGGTPALIVKLQGPFRRASWSSDGETIVYCDTTGMYKIPARGGAPTRILEHPHIEHPSFLDLPGGRQAFLYQAVDPGRQGHGIYVQLRGENQRRLITMSASINPYPVYSPTGHIVYVDGMGDSVAIWALPFSLTALQPSGKAFPIAQRGSSPMLSRTGTLVDSDVPSDRLQLLWCDRSGLSLSKIGEIQRQEFPTLSPDGSSVAFESRENEPDLWVFDLNRGIKTRLTADSAPETLGAWTPAGDEITYVSNRNGTADIFSRSLRGVGESRLLVGTPLAERTPDWSPDHRFLIYAADSPGSKSQLLYRERRLDNSLGDPVIFRKGVFNERAPRFSPDGSLVAYLSDQSGNNEVYVSDFPNGTSQRQISVNGGAAPRWRRDGREIFYLEQSKLMRVSVATTPGFSLGIPALLFQKMSLQNGYDVSADGKRFLVLDRPSGEPPLAIHVVHNWFEEFRGQHRE